MKGAQSKRAAVFLAAALVGVALLASGLLQVVPRARAQEQPSFEQARDQLQRHYSRAIQLFNRGEYEEARTAFEALEPMAADLGVKLGDNTRTAIADFLRRIDAKLAEAAAVVEEKAEAAVGPPPEEEARQARIAELRREYAKAVELYRAGRFGQAKVAFHAVAAAGAREKLFLGDETEDGLRYHIGRIDQDIATAEARRRRETAVVEVTATEEKARLDRVAALEARYEAAVAVYEEGKLAEAKVMFQAVADARTREGLILGPSVEKGLRDHLAKIDEEMVEVRRAEAVARVEAVEEETAAAARMRRIAAEKAKADAQVLYEDAIRLRDEGRLEEALAKLDRAVTVDPTHVAALGAAEGLRSELGLISPEERLIRERARIRAVQIQRDTREMNENLRRAEELMDDDEYDEALKLLNQVATRAQVGDYPAAMTQDFVERAEKLIGKAEKEKVKYEAKLAADRLKAAEREARAAERRERVTKIEQVEELFGRAEDMYVDKRYQEAESAIMGILAIEPENGVAQAYLEFIDRARSREQFLAYSTERARGLRAEFEATAEGSIPRGVKKTIVYPENWKELTRLRQELMEADRPELTMEEQALRDRLQRTVSFEFTEQPLEEVVGFLRTVADVNIVLDTRIQTDVPVTLSLRDVKLEDALDFIMDMLNLRWIIRRGVVFISDETGVQAEPFMRVYDVRDLVGTVPDFVGPEFDLESEGGDGGGGFDFGETEEDTGMAGEFVSSSQSGDEIAMLIMENVARDTWTTGARNSITFRDGNLIVVNTQEVHEEVQRLLEGLRKARALQVSMDIRFIRASDSFLVDVGAGITSATYDRQEHLLNFSIVPPVAGIGAGGGVPVGGLNLSGSFLDRLQVDYFLRAVQDAQGAVFLVSPRITVFNGQRAYIAVVTQRNLVTDIDVDVSESAVGYDIEVETISSGVVFDVRPIVSADRRYVQLDLRPSRSDVVAINSYSTGFVILPDGTTRELSIQQPVVETTELRTTVSVPDGGTLLVGGLKFSFEQEREAGVPILSQIPIISRFVTRTAAVREKDNLLILVTPRIIIQEELEKEME